MIDFEKFTNYSQEIIFAANAKKDFYYYSAKNKDGVRVTLNYEKGNFSISVFE